MNEVTLGGVDYRYGKLNAMQQFQVGRKLAPVIPTLLPLLASIGDGGVKRALEGDVSDLAHASEPLTVAISEMSDENVEYIIATCMAVVSRLDGKQWRAVWRDGSCMYDDMDAGSLLPLVVRVVQVSLGGFIAGLVTSATGSSPK